MAVEGAPLLTMSALATASLATKQFYAGTLDTSGGVSVSTAAANMDGIIQDNPPAASPSELGIFGISKAAISASQTITAGQLLEVDTGGTLKGHASGTVVAKALEALASSTSIQLITVMILKTNASF